METKTKSDIILEELKKRGSKREVIDVDENALKIVVFTLQNGHYAFYG